MKRVFYVFLLISLSGCASVTIPNYIQDVFPYKRTFYASYDEVRATVAETFEQFGWKIVNESDPALFEYARKTQEEGGKQSVIFTEIRETSFFIGSRYAKLNTYLRFSGERSTEVEIRYLNVTALPFKKFTSYKNDSAIERIFKHIEEKLSP